MRRRVSISAILALALLTFGGMQLASGTNKRAVDVAARLAYCNAIPNGTTLTVVSTSRVAIFLPKDIYPTLKLRVTFHGATAGPISNAGKDGYSQSRSAKAGCWSHYFEFDLTAANKTGNGMVDIASKGKTKSIPDYMVHFKVVTIAPNPTQTSAGNGLVSGVVLLGPVCPVAHNPPDPACAPKPYKTSIDVWDERTGSSYQRLTTDSSGSFKLSLMPGNYTLQVVQPANAGLYPRCTQTTITVIAKTKQSVTINCDTGIR